MNHDGGYSVFCLELASRKRAASKRVIGKIGEANFV